MPAPVTIQDPEKGTMQEVLADAVTVLATAEFKVKAPALELKSQDITTEVKPPAKKLKPKTSRSIRFALWFNTYRCDVFSYFTGTCLTLWMKEILRDFRHIEYDWLSPRCHKRVDVPSSLHRCFRTWQLAHSYPHAQRALRQATIPDC